MAHEDFLNPEDAKMAQAIETTAVAFGQALLVTFTQAGNLVEGDVSKEKAQSKVEKAWQDAADKLIDVMMED